MAFQDLRLAARALRRAPGFAVVAILLLGLGTGVNLLVFGLADAWLWRPLAPRADERTAYVFARQAGGGGYSDYSWADYGDVRAERSVFEDAVAYFPAPLALSHDQVSERVWGEVVSGNYFGFLGVPLVLGRSFTPDEAAGQGEFRVAVISHAFWQSRFRGARDVVGRALRVNGWDLTVIGVAPAGFGSAYYVGFHPSVWLPASLWGHLPGLGSAPLEMRGGNSFRMMVRLRPGISMVQAAQAVSVTGRRLAEAYPSSNATLSAELLDREDARPEPGVAAGFRLIFGLFLAIGAMVLLIACANLGSLQLARAMARARDLAVRAALGASRARLIGVMLAESTLLTVAGGLAGVVLAGWLGDLMARLLRFPTDIPFQFDYSPGSRAWLAGGVVLGLAFAGFGLVPALVFTRQPLAATLRSGGSGAGQRRQRLRSALVMAQLALSALLLVSAGLALRTLGGIRRVPPGIEVERQLLLTVSPGLQGYDEARSSRLYRELVARVADLPGVEGAAAVAEVPLDFSANGGVVVVEGAERRAGDPVGDPAVWTYVSPGWFGVSGTRLLEGRDVEARDSTGALPVAVVNQAMARRYWPGSSPIGRRIHLNAPDQPAVEIVGVVADGKYRNLTESPQPCLFLPLAQYARPAVTLQVRTAADPLAVVPAVRREMAALDPEVPLTNIRTMDQLLAGRALLAPRLAASLAAAAAVLAAVLAVVGLYGVISYLVSQQAREFAIRAALGASGADLSRLVLRAGMRIGLLGVGAGLVAGLGFGRLARGVLYGVGAADPLTLVAVTGLLVPVTLLASWIPARRAARVDPAAILRNE
jgi:putative ABC transport system permease protein